MTNTTKKKKKTKLKKHTTNKKNKHKKQKKSNQQAINKTQNNKNTNTTKPPTKHHTPPHTPPLHPPPHNKQTIMIRDSVSAMWSSTAPPHKTLLFRSYSCVPKTAVSRPCRRPTRIHMILVSPHIARIGVGGGVSVSRLRHDPRGSYSTQCGTP